MAVEFEPFPDLPFKSGRKRLGQMALAVLMIGALYKNLPPKRHRLWQESTDTLKGWIEGIEFFADATGGEVKKGFHRLKKLIEDDSHEKVSECSLELAQQDGIESLQEKPDAFKKAMKAALQLFQKAASEKRIELVGLLDSLRVSLAIGEPLDLHWAALDTAYRDYVLEEKSFAPVEKNLAIILRSVES